MENLELNKIYHGDCLDLMYRIPDKSIDMIFADLPYGVTKNKWDSLLDLPKLWKQYERVIKDNGAIVLFGQDKFSAKLMLSNEKLHRYNLIWKKGERTSGFLNAKKMPLRNHEDILIFYKSTPTYNPQMVTGSKAHSRGKGNLNKNNNYGSMFGSVGDTANGCLKYPKSILNFDRPHPPIFPTQKSTELCEWIIRSYTNENELVLDNTCGSGTTGLAARNLNRNFIMIEKDKEIFEDACKRLGQINN